MCHLAWYNSLRSLLTKSTSTYHVWLEPRQQYRLLTGLSFFVCWKFACLGKWIELVFGFIWSTFHAKWVAPNLGWWELHSHPSSTPIRQLWILIYFFEHLIIPPHWKPFEAQKITFNCPVGEGTVPSPFQSRSIWPLKDLFLWAPLKGSPHSLILKTLFFCQEWCLVIVHQGIHEKNTQ